MPFGMLALSYNLTKIFLRNSLQFLTKTFVLHNLKLLQTQILSVVVIKKVYLKYFLQILTIGSTTDPTLHDS